MMAPLLRVLAALHARHILHRDIKPENIFLTHALAFKLGDMVRAGPIPAPARCILAAGPRQVGRFVGPRWLHGRAWRLAMALEHGKPERSMCDG
jgi:serine/threonine protein kinase